MADPNAVPPVPPAPGLINSAPGVTNTTPGVPPDGAPQSGQSVTSYNPAQATAATANATGYDAKAFNVAPNQTVASQIKDIIASGSPLMQQAETNARNQVAQRGLINSSIGVGAAQNAVLSAALPIATAWRHRRSSRPRRSWTGRANTFGI